MILRTVHDDPRVSRDHGGMSSTVPNFVSALLARHTTQLYPHTMLTPIFRQFIMPDPGTNIYTTNEHTTNNQFTSTVERYSETHVVPTLEKYFRIREIQTAQTVERTLVERLTSRVERIETEGTRLLRQVAQQDHSFSQIALRREVPTIMPPTMRVVLPTDIPKSDEETERYTRVNNRAGSVRENNHQTQNASIDIGVLADQVIRAIDQRIISQRERLGRI